MQAVLREAMLAGAAGLATSFAITHRGVDGKPIPSRFADRAEFEALLDVMREVGRGVVAIAPGEQCGIADMYELQPRAGVPFTYGALLTSPAGTHRMQVDLNRAGWAKGAKVWPQVTPRPLKFAYTLAEPFPLNTNPEFAALMAQSGEERRAAYMDPAWRERVQKIWGDNPGFSVPRWNTYSIDESPAHPELAGRTLLDIAAERGAEPFDTMIDLALDEPDLGLRVGCVLFNDDTDEVGSLLTEEHCTIGLSDAGRARGPALRRTPGHRLPRQLGARPRPHADRDGRPQADRRAGRPARAHRPGLPGAGQLGRRRRLRPGDRRAGPDPPGS